jgi:hypothetical protein
VRTSTASVDPDETAAGSLSDRERSVPSNTEMQLKVSP